MKNLRKAALTILVAACTAMPVMAQNQPGGQSGFQGQGGGFQGQGQGGNRGAFDPAQMRQSMSDRYREALGSSDEEWAVIGPKIDKIQQLQADAGGGIAGAIGLFMRGFGGRMGGAGRAGGMGGGRGMANPFGADSVVQKKIQALQEAIDNKDMPDTEIKNRLNAVREERDKVRVELDKARKELIDLLTSRQEATLFQMGILE